LFTSLDRSKSKAGAAIQLLCNLVQPWFDMGSLGRIELTNGGTNDHSALALPKAKGNGAWRFDTLQVHAGLERSPVYGQCTLPVYSSASFKFESSAVADAAFATTDKYIYSRCQNVSLCFTPSRGRRLGRRLIWLNPGSPAMPDLRGA
jgi:hypothetical protein